MLNFHNRKYLLTSVKLCASTCDVQYIISDQEKDVEMRRLRSLKYCVGNKGQQKQRFIPSEWVLNATVGRK